MTPHRKPLLKLTWLFAMLILILAACVPARPAEPGVASGGSTATPTPTEKPTQAVDPLAGLSPDDILVQFDYEPGFTMPQYQYAFGRVPFFTLYKNGVVIYLDENQDMKIMQAQMTPEEAKALQQKLLDMGFEKIESHTDFCGLDAGGQQVCMADASTNILRVRLASGELREIKNYAGLSDYPATYTAITDMLNQYTNPQAVLYRPAKATLFISILPQSDQSSPAAWPLDAKYVEAAKTAGDLGFIARVLTSDEVNQYLDQVGLNNSQVVFQQNSQPVAATLVPWLPGVDYSAEIQQAFPAK
jgi:hypothetical protein